MAITETQTGQREGLHHIGPAVKKVIEEIADVRKKPTFTEMAEMGRKTKERAASRHSLVLSDEEFSLCLSEAQKAWRKLGVEPLSFISNSDNLLNMNKDGKGEAIRATIKNYRAIEGSIPPCGESTFCYLPDQLEPQISAMREVWHVQSKASPEKMDLASEEIRRRNHDGLGRQLEKFFSVIPAITRMAINGKGPKLANA